MNILKELEFIDNLDGKFPYENRNDCVKLIDEAISISPNALYAIVEEIARIPDEDREIIPFLSLLDLLKAIDTKFNHPLKKMILKVASNMVKGQETSLEETLLNLEEVRKFPRLFSALNIVYYSCFGDEKKLNAAWDNIIKEWDNSL
jgi:hypothetical protein